MQFKKQHGRLAVIGLGVGLAVDAGAAYLLTMGEYDPSGTWLILFLAAQAAWIIYALRGALINFILFKLGVSSVVTDELFELLREYKFPRPEAYERSADDYLQGVADNEDLPLQTRLIAATRFGLIKGQTQGMGITRAVMAGVAMERGIARYREECFRNGDRAAA